MVSKPKTLATSKIGRITQRPEYLSVANTGRKWVTPSFILQADHGTTHQSDDSTPAKVGFTVSKKVGNAVMRSKARRRLKEAARASFPEHAPNGWSFVLIGRNTAVHYPFKKMCADMTWALAKLASGTDLKKSNKRQKSS
ncbi:ribonuclease P protein component [Kordiimonas aquimaris]|uniref:ribonuclease P protein component n=1 Tax=Kordiimonas aquimaris TaxID=707591 RepID=UPI0021D1FC3E|nr:ribonuclease P protein component [Kordiimonas aquimaris]